MRTGEMNHPERIDRPMARKSPAKQKTQKKRRPILTLFKWGLVLGIWLFIALLGVIAYYGHDLPDIARAATFERKRSLTFYAADGETVIARYGELLGRNLTFEELPKNLVNAVIATEDRRFYYHFGIDPIGITRAMMTNVQAQKIAQGGSTITQQLAKNLFLSSDRTIRRKIQEALLAVWLESRYTKEEIIAAYLNRVYMGAGAYGVDAAAEVYFNKPAQNLTLQESAILAGLLKAPSRYNPVTNPQTARERMKVVLGLMEENGMIEKQEDRPSSKTVMIKPEIKPYSITDSNENDRYFTDWIVDQLSAYIGDSGGDLVIYTTLDPDLQEQAATAARQYTAEYVKDGKTDAPEFALILVDTSGAVKSMLGGSSYSRSQFNRATQAMRQPGSSFKPFVYLSALQQGWTPNTLISDTPFSKNGYRPENHTGEYHGDVPLWEALAQSYNVAAVRLLEQSGVDGTIRTARALGISTPIHPDLSIALGTSDTTLLDMVFAYHTIARQGQPAQPYGIMRIERAEDQKVIFDSAPLREQAARQNTPVIDPVPIMRLTGMLQEVVNQGTGRRAAQGFPVAGKTGTSQENRNAWFMGFSSDYTAGVWVGYDDNRPMKGVYGGTIPASIWADAMRAAHARRAGRALVAQTAGMPGQPGAFDRMLGRIMGGSSGAVDFVPRGGTQNRGDQPRRPVGNNPNRF